MEETKQDEKKYSWGELYETTKEMEKNGEEITSPILQKFFKLFHALDNAKSIDEARTIVYKHQRPGHELYILKEEQDYINSSCFDGILRSIDSNSPLVRLLNQKKEYVETCKYYLSKDFVKRALFKAIEYDKPKTKLRLASDPNSVRLKF
jgi:CRISPR/Cas system-associated endonuclease Cas3-HD